MVEPALEAQMKKKDEENKQFESDFTLARRNWPFTSYLKKWWWVFVLGSFKTYSKYQSGEISVGIIIVSLVFAFILNYVIYLTWVYFNCAKIAKQNCNFITKTTI